MGSLVAIDIIKAVYLVLMDPLEGHCLAGFVSTMKIGCHDTFCKIIAFGSWIV